MEFSPLLAVVFIVAIVALFKLERTNQNAFMAVFLMMLTVIFMASVTILNPQKEVKKMSEYQVITRTTNSNRKDMDTVIQETIDKSKGGRLIEMETVSVRDNTVKLIFIFENN